MKPEVAEGALDTTVSPLVHEIERPDTAQGTTISPHMQEIECALILQRMIDMAKNDPAQMRLAIYEFARAKVKIDSVWADKNERERLSKALETAIRGVEDFSVRREEAEWLPALGPPTQAAPADQTLLATVPVTVFPRVNVTGAGINASVNAYVPSRVLRPATARSILLTAACVVVLFGVTVGLAYHRQGLRSIGSYWNADQPSALKTPVSAVLSNTSQQASVPSRAEHDVAARPPFPLPKDYGVYALMHDELIELYTLPGRVPDKRIAISMPIDKPSRTILADGQPKFIIFRRDLAGDAPDRVEVRVVARVVRALKFDAKGKPNLVPVSDAWNIRSASYELRVRPIRGNPEMLLVQSDKPDFALPSGRYVLVMKDQGYDFTVAGSITDPAHCLEQTDAANGTFYSQCLKF